MKECSADISPRTNRGNPLFSIVMVCLNAEKTIYNALLSVREQNHRDYECVIIDGGSNDETLRILNSFGDLPLVISSKPDNGIYDAMNKGVMRARGEIIFFLNADDRLHDSNVLTQIEKIFNCNSDLDILFGDVIYLFEDGREKRETHENINPKSLIYGSLCHQAVFARRRLFLTHGSFNTRYLICADYDWLLRILHAGAKYRHFRIDIAYFARGGMHEINERNKAILHEERLIIRRNYLYAFAYVLDVVKEFRRRLKKIRKTYINRIMTRSRHQGRV